MLSKKASTRLPANGALLTGSGSDSEIGRVSASASQASSYLNSVRPREERRHVPTACPLAWIFNSRIAAGAIATTRPWACWWPARQASFRGRVHSARSAAFSYPVPRDLLRGPKAGSDSNRLARLLLLGTVSGAFGGLREWRRSGQGW